MLPRTCTVGVLALQTIRLSPIVTAFISSCNKFCFECPYLMQFFYFIYD